MVTIEHKLAKINSLLHCLCKRHLINCLSIVVAVAVVVAVVA